MAGAGQCDLCNTDGKAGMKKKPDLYNTLGVPVKASMDNIKEAFRKKAKKAHPDRGGDPEEFRALMLAYDILSDEEKRKRYDGGENPDSMSQEQPPIGMIFAIFNQIIDNINADLIHNDLFEIIRQNIRANIQNMQAQKSTNQNNIKKYGNVIKRIKKSGKSEPYIRFLEDKIRDCNSVVLQIERNIKTGEDALILLDGCEYDFEPLRRTIILNYGDGGTSTSGAW
jgi:hypothetical protein